MQKNNYPGFQNRGNNPNMNSNNTLFVNSNFRNNQNNNNFDHQDNSLNMGLAQSQVIPNNRNVKKLNIQLTPDEQNFFPKIYNMLDNSNTGRILGKPAANFMKKSNLAKQVLKEIWLIAAQSSNTYILRDEFYVALRLIALAQNNMPFTAQNIEMNNPIPPLPNFDLNNNNIQNNNNNIQNNNNQNNFNQNNFNQNNFSQNNFNQNNNNGDLFEISDKEKSLFCNIFNNRKEPGLERITAHNAILIWKKNNAEDNAIKIVANIIKPLENKGFFNLKEFIVACHLIAMSKKCELPQKLPDVLVNFLGRNNNNNMNNNINNYNTNPIRGTNSNLNNFNQLSNSPIENNNCNRSYTMKNNNDNRIQEIFRKEEELIKKNNILNNQINQAQNKINDLVKEIELIQKRQNDISNELRNVRQECNNLRNNGNTRNMDYNSNINNSFAKKNSESNISAKDSKKNLNSLIAKNLENIGKNMRYDTSDLNSNNELNITNKSLASKNNNKNEGYPNLESKKPDIMDLMNNLDLNNNNTFDNNNGNNNFNNNNGSNSNNFNNNFNNNIKEQHENKKNEQENNDFNFDDDDGDNFKIDDKEVVNPYQLGNDNKDEDNGSNQKNGDDGFNFE